MQYTKSCTNINESNAPEPSRCSFPIAACPCELVTPLRDSSALACYPFSPVLDASVLQLVF